MEDEEIRKKEQNSKWFKSLTKLFKEDDVFWNNEVKANLFVTTCLEIELGIIILSYILARVGVFDVPKARMDMVLALDLPALVLAIIVTAVTKAQKHWTKYVLCIISLFFSISLTSVLSIFVTLVIIVPIILSVRYYSRKFTLFVFSVSIIGMVISEFLFSYYGMLDLNLVYVPGGTTLTIPEGQGLRDAIINNGYSQLIYIENLFRGSFMPRLLFVFVVGYVCSELSYRAHELVIDQTEISKKSEGMKAELNMATNIQESVLPKIFPAFPERPDIEIHAKMDPAKEVGGDFYDYYLLDDDHLFMVIADVSGKGVPAALFMMISKILIKTHAYIEKTPAAIAAAVNNQLCEDNSVELFVTAWMGVLEISTGTVTAVDAGHEYPLIRHGNGKFEVVKGAKSFVLAGMEDVPFKEFTFKMEKGDMLFLYTDGLPEATNAQNELYGMRRMLDSANSHVGDSTEELLVHIRKDVDDFVKDAPQFDDLTMLAVKVNP